MPFESPVLSRILPIEIRDQRHALVATLRAERAIKLPEGLYSISAVLDSGERVTKPVHVKYREATVVHFQAEDPAVERQCTSLVLPMQQATNAFVSALFSDQLADEAMLADLLQPSDASADRVAASKIWVAAASPGLSISQSDDGHMIHARLEADSRPSWLLIASPAGVLYRTLPLSSDPACAECTLVVRTDSAGKLEAKVVLAPERRIGKALHGLIETGKLGLGVDLARAAIHLLAGDHADPISAAYSGLLLQRFGLLEEHAKPIENLARDFPWIPDGLILLAAVLSLSRRPAQVRRGHQLLMEATRSSPIFADAFSLALALLRRWPDEDGEAERQARLEALTGAIAHFDFTSTLATMQWSSTEIAASVPAIAVPDPASEVHPDVLRWLAEVIVKRYVSHGIPFGQILEQFAADNRSVVEHLGLSGVAALLHVLRADHDVDLGALTAWPLMPDTYQFSEDLEDNVEAVRRDGSAVGIALVADQFGSSSQLSPAEEARWRSDYREAFEDGYIEGFEQHLGN
ncbi:MAG TPA: hypothetical protein VHT91_14380 [Kofleriaceae bacterium]|nr:hypothetical protein [Kofleriaceae bacterium]